jgi:hypothetical protein
MMEPGPPPTSASRMRRPIDLMVIFQFRLW